ncbi:uncharacterized protein LOC124914389 [Impatiens glandulifera]|uniref:uncharacterized protein LOC124914389 n=1 Tax=Impatiens glandulifera TaxID=253017 RepID=UPI001FB0BE57|nr:uncharacterized protein LOC124914389 [Impatiens glandulifera]
MSTVKRRHVRYDSSNMHPYTCSHMNVMIALSSLLKPPPDYIMNREPRKRKLKMINILAVTLLLLTTLTTHGVLYPPAPVPDLVQQPHSDDVLEVLIKHGSHRLVIDVEYQTEADGAAVITTKVSNIDGHNLEENKHDQPPLLSHPKELVCDAFGKCKHKFSTLLFKAKEKVSETVHDTKETVEDTADKLRQTITEGVSDKIEDMKETIKQTTEQAKETITHDIPEKANQTKQAVDRAKGSAGKELVQIFRRVRAIVFDDAIAYTFSPWAVKSLVELIHLLGYATAYGMSVWVTFVSSHVLAGALPRQQFGIVQSKIYPVYFKTLSLCIGLSLMGHLLGQWRRLKSRSADMFQAYSLFSALIMTLVNLWYMEPKATKVMFERMKVERELEGRGRVQEPAGKVVGVLPAVVEGEKELDGRERKKIEAGERLKSLNTYSSLLNVLTLMALTSHLVYLGQRLSLVM